VKRSTALPVEPATRMCTSSMTRAVSGADAIDARAGFAAMLKRIEGNGVRPIIVETASRFARDLMVQEVGYAMLKQAGSRRGRAGSVAGTRPLAHHPNESV
jgi:hypothetical protein